jgi:hypothetical protein
LKNCLERWIFGYGAARIAPAHKKEKLAKPDKKGWVINTN